MELRPPCVGRMRYCFRQKQVIFARKCLMNTMLDKFRDSRNPKVHYRTHKRPPPVSILGQPNLVHIHTSHLLESRPNIIHPSTLRSPQWSLSLRFPHQDPTNPPLLTHTCHIPSPSNSSRFYHSHDIG